MSWTRSLFFLLTGFSLFSSRTVAQTGNITYNEAIRTVMSATNYEQAFTAFEGIGPAIVLVVLIPLLWNLVYAGFIEEWRCDNYWMIFLSTALVAVVMLIAFPYLLMVL